MVRTPAPQCETLTSAEVELLNYLEMVSGLYSNRQNAVHAYHGYEHLVAEVGRVGLVAETPEQHGEWLAEFDVETGPAKMCFRNAGMYAGTEGLYYTEGYATSIIPVHHGWLMTEDGRVLDPTWHGQGEGALPVGAAYVGVAFHTEAVMRVMAELEVWGMFSYTKPQLLLNGVEGLTAQVGRAVPKPLTPPKKEAATWG